MFNEGNQIHNFMSSSGSGTVINYGFGSGSDFLSSYGSGSTSQNVTVPTVPVPVPQHWAAVYILNNSKSEFNPIIFIMNAFFRNGPRCQYSDSRQFHYY
jgi:hypothetical protein